MNVTVGSFNKSSNNKTGISYHLGLMISECISQHEIPHRHCVW